MATTQPTARARRRAPRRAGLAVVISIGLHGLALAGASALMAGTAFEPRERGETPVVLRLDLRRELPEHAPIEVSAVIAKPIPEPEPLPMETPEPLDRDAWSEPLVVLEGEVVPDTTRRDGEFPEPAGERRGLVRVPRRATAPGPAAAAGVGAPSGDGSGAVVAGTGGGTAPTTGSAGGTDESGGGSGATAAVRAIHTPAPEYPPAARRRGEQGTVGCRIHIRADGTVDGVEIVSSSGSERLDRAAVEALATWRFEPALRRGEAIASAVNQDVRFSLRS